MKKKNKTSIYIILLVYFFVCFDIYANITLQLTEKITFKSDKVYSSYQNSLYIIQDKTLYEVKEQDVIEIFTNRRGITGIVFNEDILVVFNIDEIFVLNIFNKKVLWWKKIKGRIIAEPVISSSKIFIDKNAVILIAFDINTGKRIWKFNISSPEYSFFTTAKLLQTNDYLIYIYTNNKVFILYKDTGVCVKKYNIENVDSVEYRANLRMISARIYNDIIYSLYENGMFFAFDIRSGNFIWETVHSRYLDLFVYKDKILFFESNGELALYDKFTNKNIWKESKFSDGYYAPIILTRLGIILMYNKFGNIIALNIKDGTVILATKLKFNVKKILSSVSEEKIWLFTTSDKILFLKFK
ncbi:MAG TPA: PQQ-binding-like beta-propeller repeat protein [Candidatus Azoamicus sp. OHIO2]